MVTNAKRVTEGSLFSKVSCPFGHCPKIFWNRPPPFVKVLPIWKKCPQTIWASDCAALKHAMHQFMSHFHIRASLSTNVIVKRAKGGGPSGRSRDFFMLLFPFIICVMPVQSNPCSCRGSRPGRPPPPDATCCQCQPPPSSSSWATD